MAKEIKKDQNKKKFISFQDPIIETRPIENIVKELTKHPDCINHFILTIQGVKSLIRSKIEHYYKDEIEKDKMVENIYQMNKEIITDAIGILVDVSYEEFFSLDFINYPQEFIELDERVKAEISEFLKKTNNLL